MFDTIIIADNIKLQISTRIYLHRKYLPRITFKTSEKRILVHFYRAKEDSSYAGYHLSYEVKKLMYAAFSAIYLIII